MGVALLYLWGGPRCVSSVPMTNTTLSEIAEDGTFRFDCIFTPESRHFYKYTLDFRHGTVFNNTPEHEVEILLYLNSKYVDSEHHSCDSFTSGSVRKRFYHLLPGNYLVDGANNASVVLIFKMGELDSIGQDGLYTFSNLDITRRSLLYVQQ